MRFPEPVRMADGVAAPIWERSGKRGGFNPVGLLGVLLALVGVLFLVLRFTDHSFAAAGARVDGWVNVPVSKVKGLMGKEDAEPAPAPAEAPAPAAAPAEAAAAADQAATDAAAAPAGAAAPTAAPAPAATKAPAPAKT